MTILAYNLVAVKEKKFGWTWGTELISKCLKWGLIDFISVSSSTYNPIFCYRNLAGRLSTWQYILDPLYVCLWLFCWQVHWGSWSKGSLSIDMHFTKFFTKMYQKFINCFWIESDIATICLYFHLCDNSYMYTLYIYMNCTCQSSYLLCTSKQVKVFSCICPISA